MGLKEAVVSSISATFSGRAQSEYWFFYLFNIIMSFVTSKNSRMDGALGSTILY